MKLESTGNHPPMMEKPKLRRIRTIKECYEYIRTADPNTAFSQRYIGDVCRSLPGTIRRGRLYWVDLDELLEFLNDPSREERVLDYEESHSKIRPVTAGRR